MFFVGFRTEDVSREGCVKQKITRVGDRSVRAKRPREVCADLPSHTLRAYAVFTLAPVARFERVALAIQRRQEEREYHRLAALGLVPPGVSISELRDQLRSTTTNAAMTRAPSFFEDHHYQGR